MGVNFVPKISEKSGLVTHNQVYQMTARPNIVRVAASYFNFMTSNV